MSNLWRMFEASAERNGSALALTDGISGASQTYAELAARARRAGNLLRELSVLPGDKVALYLENSSEYAAFYLGTLGIGAVAVPFHSLLLPPSVAPLIEECEAKVVVTSPRHAHAARQLLTPVRSLRAMVSTAPTPADFPPELAYRQFDPESPADAPLAALVDEGDLAMVLYTSGTTGRPKGVMLTHRNLLANTRSVLEYLGLSREDSQVAVLPWAYSYGNSVFLTHLAVGARLVIDNRLNYPTSIVQTMEDQSVTGFSGVQSHYALLVYKSDLCRRSLPRFRYATCAGGPFPWPLIETLRASWPALRIFCMYGQTEASARLSYLPPERLDAKRGSIGIPIPGVELSILRPDGCEAAPGEIGEIVARGDNIMAGYLKAPDKTAEVLRAEGLWTGDAASRDEDGFIFIAGRKRDIIKTGGNRVSPLEIEEALLRIDGVLECAVAGVPDRIFGEAVCAAIVARNDFRLSDKDVRHRLRGTLEAFKIPHRIAFLPVLPKTAGGKTDREALKRRFADEAVDARSDETRPS